MAFVGIDLGTTYSCIAVSTKGGVDIIENNEGHRITPSCVAFSKTERLVGETAEHHMSSDPKNAVYDVKRIIGCQYDHDSVQNGKKKWPFDLVDNDGHLKIKVMYRGEEKLFHPEEISSVVLEHMKSIAEDRIGNKVASAVITVPAQFNDQQRRATRAAAEIAGLNVLAMINEPTAAALAYGLLNKTRHKRHVLVYDLGGGTFDVTVLTIQNFLYKVLATGGNVNLGGQDFNDRLYNYLLEKFTEENNVDLSSNVKAQHRLRAECEKVKKMLSSSKTFRVGITNFYKDTDFEMSVSRSQFEKLCDDLFQQTMTAVCKVLDESNVTKEQIDEVVLVGGSSRIPRLQEMLKKYFGEDKLCKTINPDEAVAYGAAVGAELLSENISETMQDIQLHDVIPLSLGVETTGGIMTVFMKKNTPIPATAVQMLTTSEDNQTEIPYRVFEGEQEDVKLNNELGSFSLTGLPPLPAGEVKTEVCFEIDSSGVLHVSARDLSDSGIEDHLDIRWDKGRQSEGQIRLMIAQAEWFRKQDKINSDKVHARYSLESAVNKGYRILEDEKAGSGAERRALKKMCDKTMKWMTKHKEASKEAMEEKHEELIKTLQVFE